MAHVHRVLCAAVQFDHVTLFFFGIIGICRILDMYGCTYELASYSVFINRGHYILDPFSELLLRVYSVTPIRLISIYLQLCGRIRGLKVMTPNLVLLSAFVRGCSLILLWEAFTARVSLFYWK